MKIKHYMSTDLKTVKPDTRITDAIDLMEENKIHRLPVIEDGRFVGLVTDDVIAQNQPSGLTSLSIYEMNYLFDKVQVSSVMLKDVPTTQPETPLEEAAIQMLEENVSVLPVLEADQIVGIVTHKDIFKALIDYSGYTDPGSRFNVIIKEDRPGLMAEISGLLASKGINISHILVNSPTEDEILITLQVEEEGGAGAQEALEAAGYEVQQVK